MDTFELANEEWCSVEGDVMKTVRTTRRCAYFPAASGHAAAGTSAEGASRVAKPHAPRSAVSGYVGG